MKTGRRYCPIIQNPATLEYEISSTVKRLTDRTQRKIGFLSGQGSPEMKEFSKPERSSAANIELVPVDVSRGTPVPPDIGALFVIAPTAPFPEPVKFQIDQYLMNGGKVAFLLNRIDANLQNQTGRPLDLNLDDMLGQYGLHVNADLVRDMQCANVTIVQQQFGMNMQSQIPFPYLPLVSGFNSSNMMVKDLQNVILFFASSIDTIRGSFTRTACRGSCDIIEAERTSDGCFHVRSSPAVHTRSVQREGDPLAAVVEGSFASLYAGRPAPADTTPGAIPPTATPVIKSPTTRVVLVGDGDFVRDQYTGGNRSNMTLFANMVDYLVDDAGLITIRSKDASFAPLDPVSDGTKKVLKYGTLVLPPLLVLAYGAFRWRMRKARKKALEIQ